MQAQRATNTFRICAGPDRRLYCAPRGAQKNASKIIDFGSKNGSKIIPKSYPEERGQKRPRAPKEHPKSTPRTSKSDFKTILGLGQGDLGTAWVGGVSGLLKRLPRRFSTPLATASGGRRNAPQARHRRPPLLAWRFGASGCLDRLCWRDLCFRIFLTGRDSLVLAGSRF